MSEFMHSGGRAAWAYQEVDDDEDDDGEVAVSASEKGVLIEVTQDHAVDSYNQEFTCSAFVPWSEVDKLIEVLNATRP